MKRRGLGGIVLPASFRFPFSFPSFAREFATGRAKIDLAFYRQLIFLPIKRPSMPGPTPIRGDSPASVVKIWNPAIPSPANRPNIFPYRGEYGNKDGETSRRG